MIKRLKKWLGRYKQPDQVLLLAYRSYGTREHIYIKGRALDNEPLKIVQEQSFLKTLKNTYKQFDSFELPEVKIELHLPQKVTLEVKTNAEGYFLFDEAIDLQLEEDSNFEGWVDYEISYKETIKEPTRLLENPFHGKFLIPRPDAQFGVISDIDDTIMHTGVTSFLKWRLIKNSLLTNAYKRIPLQGAPNLYKKLHEGPSKEGKNPIFYLSNSPWNLYEYLKLFLDFNEFPTGPILLRDLATPFDKALSEKPHKQKEILNILNTYPNLKFILIGDSGEHDASIYTEIAEKHSEQILVIYLRSVNHPRQMRRVKNIFNNFDSTPVLLVNSSQEAVAHARESGFIS